MKETDPSATTLLLKIIYLTSLVIYLGCSQVCVRSEYLETMRLESILDPFEEIIISRETTDKENAL